jgi:hypothetical protein
MTGIFISYARDTQRAAETVARALAAEGLEAWLDQALPVHRSYSEVIEEQIAAADAVLVIWSAPAVKSEWVRAEAEAGRTARKLVQIVIDDAAPPLPFSQIQVAQLQGWRGGRTHPEWRKVVASINQVRAAPTTSPGPAEATGALSWLGARPWAVAAAGAAAILAVGGAVVLGRMSARPSTPAAAAPAVANPSFSCADAASQMERYICAEPAVAAAELEMAGLYRQAMAATDDKTTLRSSQRDFLIKLAASPFRRDVFIGLYRQRSAELRGIVAKASTPEG